MPNNLLTPLGFGHLPDDAVDPQRLKDFQLARVTAVNRDRYDIHNGTAEITAEITGKLRATAQSATDLPATGDWVYVQFFDDDSLGIIHEVVPRYSWLRRKSAGKNIDIQMIAANIDRAFVVQAMDRDFNLRRLERYVAMIYDGHIAPQVLLSKSDLVDPAEQQRLIAEIHAIFPDLPVQAFSNTTGEGLEAVRRLMAPATTCCLLGSSGVGKTTLLNSLVGEERYETGELRRDHRGRHTTTRRQLILLPEGAILLDTPGMRELGTIGLDEGIDETFPEIVALVENCQFNDCRHVNEKGCAVLAALESGEISRERYESYQKLRRESAHNQMAYWEKRQRDKEFGKMIKSIMKDKKGKR